MFFMVADQPERAGLSTSSDDALARARLYTRQIPAWALSFAIHLAGLTVIALVVPHLPQGAAEEAQRPGGIVLVSRSAGPPQYLSEEDAGGSLAAANELETSNAAAGSAQSATEQSPELTSQLAGLLPPSPEAVAGSEAVGAGTENATQMTKGTRGPALGAGHSYAQTGVFGVKGQGTKFVYVFDRSGSMDGFAGRPLAAAKRELLASLGDLGQVHQFQIIFYNERPTILTPTPGVPAKMHFGTEADKQVAGNFVRGMLADGGTRHLEALRMALRMKPDVIFFLTDADEPTLTNAELDEIRRLNNGIGCSINAIEFGVGPQRNTESFLVRIARENSGHHAYVDLTKLPGS
jgi:hypothetical protein